MKKGSFALNMKLYLGTMSKEKRKEIKDLITSKDYGELKRVIKEGHSDFCNAGHTEETEGAVNDGIAAYIKELEKASLEKASKKPLKSGRVYEVIKQDLTVKNTRADERLAKAKAKAEKSSRKAKEDQAVVESLQNGLSDDSEAR